MELLITGADLFTAVGASAEITYFSVRAGLSRFTETGALSRQRAPRVAAVLPGFRHSRDERRLAALAAESAERALDHAKIDGAHNIGVMLCLPGPPRPDAPISFDSWTSTFAETFGGRGIVPRMRAFCEGSASIALALQEAATRLDRGEEEATLIGGADSWLSLHALRWLEDRRRLKIGRRTEGLMAGEAAGFIVLESPRHRIGREHPFAVVRAASLAHEPGHYDSNEACLSFGYTEAVRAALRDGGSRRSPGVLLSDLNGESYKAKEWAVAELRSLPQSAPVHLHPADCFGDVGSMTGVTQLAIAAIGLSRGEWVAPVMVVTGSDGPARAVVLADRADGGGRIEPDLNAHVRVTQARSDAGEVSAALVDDHLEEAGFLRLQRRLAEGRSAERWSDRDSHDRRHAWHLLALAALVPHAGRRLTAAAIDEERPYEDRAAAVAALVLAGTASVQTVLGQLRDGNDTDVPTLREALDDLPQAARQSLGRLSGSGEGLFEVEEGELLVILDRATSADVRERAVAALVEQNSEGLQRMLASSRLVGVLPAETVAWAAARGASRDAPDLARGLSEAEITPRLLATLGSAGYPGAIEILLGFVADVNEERADAAASALAVLSGIDLIEPGGEDDDAGEIWSRSAEHWGAAIGRVWSQLRSHGRVVRGSAWSSERVAESLSARHARNGVRRVLMNALRPQGHLQPTTAYYWLQRRAPG